MADVLIVCVREDEPQAKALADMFERAGFSVGGAPSNDAALRSSGAGVVVWSHASIRSRPFLDAAQRVVNANKAVVACLIEPPPSASINDSPAFDLQGWSGDPDDPSLDPLFFAVDRMVNTARAAVGAPAAAPPEAEAFEPPPNLRPAPATPPYARAPAARTAPPQTRTPPAAPTPPGFQMRTPAAPPRTPPPEPPAPDPLSSEAEHWRAIRHSTNVADFLDYLQRYGAEGAFSELAENRLKQLQAAQRPQRAPEPPPQAYQPPSPQPQPQRREARRPDPPPPMFEAPPEAPRRREPPPERRYDSERLFDSPRGASYAMREEPKKAGGGGFVRMLIIFLFMGGAALGAGYYFGFMPSMLTAGVSGDTDTTETAATDTLPEPDGAEVTGADGAGGPAVDFSSVQEPAAASTPRQQTREAPREASRQATGQTQGQTQTSASTADTTVPSPQYSWREAANTTPPSPGSYGGPVSLTPSSPGATTSTTQPPVTAPQTTPASTTPQAPATPPGTVSWASRPTAARIAALYPARALRDNVGGRVVLDCGVRADFSVSCTVVSETPTGAGFGQAAMSAANSYRAATTLSNGQSAVGARARLALVFRPPQD